MTPREVVALLQRAGVEVAIRGGKLCVRPRPPPGLVEIVRRHAPGLRALLAAAGEPTGSEAVHPAETTDLAERLSERAAILEFDAGLQRAEADRAAVRIVQCSTCRHWTADPLGGGGIGTCATGADADSWSAHDRRPVSAWPDAPRHCDGWESGAGTGGSICGSPYCDSLGAARISETSDAERGTVNG